jgi:hypothetical protein
MKYITCQMPTGLSRLSLTLINRNHNLRSAFLTEYALLTQKHFNCSHGQQIQAAVRLKWVGSGV